MSIHSEIRRRRLALGLSYARLAAAISEREQLSKPLTWQTVQQWERENGTAPKRARLKAVAEALQTTVPELLGEAEQALEPPTQVARESPAAYFVNTLSAAVATLGERLAAEIDPDLRQDIADALHKLAMRHGAARDQETLLSLLITAERHN